MPALDIVDQDVKPPEVLDGIPHQLAGRLAIGKIMAEDGMFGGDGGEVGLHLRQGFFPVEIIEAGADAAPGQIETNGLADAFDGAENQRHAFFGWCRHRPFCKHWAAWVPARIARDLRRTGGQVSLRAK